MNTLRARLIDLASKFNEVGLSHREFSRMVRLAGIVAPSFGMPSGELLDMLTNKA
jgi:hypothetical protein